MCFLPEVFFALRGYFKELQLKGNLFDYPYIYRDDSYTYHEQNRVGEFANF